MIFNLRINQYRKVRINVSVVLLILAILALPINLKIVGPLRVLDFIILILIILNVNNTKLRTNTLLTYVAIAAFGGISTFLAVMSYGIQGWSTIFFIYKFTLPILIFKTLESIQLNRSELRLLINTQLLTYIFLMVWVYIYLYRVYNGLYYGNFRPSLPFNEDPYATEAHYYSTILWMFFVLYFIIYKPFANQLLKILIFGLAVSSALLTGGRSGIVLLVVFLAIYGFLIFRPYLKTSRIPLYLIGLLVLGFFITIYIDKILEVRVLERALQFELANDASASGRITKLVASFENNEYAGYVMGRGFLSQSILWYDGAFSMANAYFGLSGIIFIIILITNFFLSKVLPHKRKNKELYIALMAYTISYIGVNFVTEYYLLTRSIFPFLLNFVIIQQFLGDKEHT